MSYDLVIEPDTADAFAPGQVDAAVARHVQFRRYDAESYRSAGGLALVLVADRPGAPIDSLVLQIPYETLPASFDAACDVALGLAGQLGGRVTDAQLGADLTAETRAASRAKAEETARWVRRLGAQFEEPPKAYVDAPAARPAAPPRTGDRPWWKFWARD